MQQCLSDMGVREGKRRGKGQYSEQMYCRLFYIENIIHLLPFMECEMLYFI